MYEYLNGNYLLSKEHFGFCKNHSTEFAAINLLDDISKENRALQYAGNIVY